MPAVSAAVEIFYRKVTADDRIAHFFTNIPMHEQSAKLKAFLAYAFGAPLRYTGKSMRDAHGYMNLNESHFGAVAEHLVSTLQELSVPPELIDEVVVIALGTKADVLNA